MLVVMEQLEKEELKAELRQIVGVAMDYFKSQVDLIAEQYCSLVDCMDGMDTKIDVCVSRIDILSIEVGFLRRDVDAIKADIVVIKSDIVIIKSDVLNMKTDIASIKTDLRGKADARDMVMLDRRVCALETTG